MNGVPFDILEKLDASRGKKRKSLEINVFWAALNDAIEYIECCIDSDTRPNKKLHDAKYLAYMSQLKRSLWHYKRVRNSVIREGNATSWE